MQDERMSKEIWTKPRLEELDMKSTASGQGPGVEDQTFTDNRS